MPARTVCTILTLALLFMPCTANSQGYSATRQEFADLVDAMQEAAASSLPARLPLELAQEAWDGFSRPTVLCIPSIRINGKIVTARLSESRLVVEGRDRGLLLRRIAATWQDGAEERAIAFGLAQRFDLATGTPIGAGFLEGAYWAKVDSAPVSIIVSDRWLNATGPDGAPPTYRPWGPVLAGLVGQIRTIARQVKHLRIGSPTRPCP